MTTTYQGAIDAMYGQFNSAWVAATSLIGYAPAIQWSGVEKDVPLDMSKFWARVSQRTVLRAQASLSNDVGIPGKKRYTTTGLIFVQLFCPREVTRAMELGRALGVIARDAFSGHTAAGVVWFRRARINELDPEEEAYRFNVVAEYEYDELG